MNKLFTALLVTACAGAMAQTVVYDYSASIKRIQPEVKKVKVAKATTIGERYKVVSDKIVGYVQLPICLECNGTLTTTADEDVFTGYAWLTRNDSTLKKAAKAGDINYFTKVAVKAEAALFGSFVDVTLPQATNRALDPKNAKNVWMSLSYAMPDTTLLETLSLGYLLKGTAYEVDYGMLGYTHNTATTVYETGFGTAATAVTAATIDICGSTPGYSCVVVNQVSGTITGWPGYEGPCGAMPMWDICDFDGTTVDVAVICGTWSIKLDKKMTNAGLADAQELAIIAALGKNGYGIDATDTIPAPIPTTSSSK